MKKTDFVFFWDGIYSQWHRAPMVIDGIEFNCCEQYMMYKKATLFGDEEIAQQIMASRSPHHQKQLGRAVKNFNKVKWEAVCRDIVYEGNLAKFNQHPQLASQLLATGNKPIVEASPFDTIWGIGLGEDHPDAVVPENWKGKNWLGEAIMRVRETIRSENNDHD